MNDLYLQAEDDLSSAQDLYSSGKYRNAVFLCTRAGEKFLKSILDTVPHDLSLNVTHKSIEIYNALCLTYSASADVERASKLLTKYASRAAYPAPGMVFDKKLADFPIILQNIIFVKFVFMICVILVQVC